MFTHFPLMLLFCAFSLYLSVSEESLSLSPSLKTWEDRSEDRYNDASTDSFKNLKSSFNVAVVSLILNLFYAFLTYIQY